MCNPYHPQSGSSNYKKTSRKARADYSGDSPFGRCKVPAWSDSPPLSWALKSACLAGISVIQRTSYRGVHILRHQRGGRGCFGLWWQSMTRRRGGLKPWWRHIFFLEFLWRGETEKTRCFQVSPRSREPFYQSFPAFCLSLLLNIYFLSIIHLAQRSRLKKDKCHKCKSARAKHLIITTLKPLNNVFRAFPRDRAFQTL